MAARPPLGLSVVVRDLSGAETIWWSGDRYAYNRPQNVTFSTRRGNGFAEFSCTLARDARLDWVDLQLLSDVIVVGDDGTVLYEGRLMSTPRSFDSAQGSSISITATGWMDYLNSRPFSEVYVDRNLQSWGPPSVQMRLANATGSWGNGDPSVAPDATTGSPSLVVAVSDTWAATAKARAEGWYDAGPSVAIGSLYYAWKKNTNVNSGDANWFWRAHLSTDDIETTTDATANLIAAGPGTGTLTATSPSKRYARVQLLYNAAGGTAGTAYEIYWTMLAVVGTHGLTNRQTIAAPSTGPALYLSDILENIVQRYAPKISTTGVQDNTTLIEHFVCDKTTPFAALQDLNKYALWQLSVFEDRTLHFYQADLTDYDFEIRLSDPGVSTSLQGDDANELRNGVVVVYQDVSTGKENTLYPTDWADLRDDDPTNPANLAGEQRWGSDPYSLSVPCTQAMALQFGRLALAQYNAPKEAGTVTLTGHVRDRANHWVPVSQVREGHTVAITDFANSRPRLVFETSYSDDDKTLNLSVDNTFATLDAIIDRASLGLAAAGLV